VPSTAPSKKPRTEHTRRADEGLVDGARRFIVIARTALAMIALNALAR
jgi:hypothetical protein